MRAVGTHRGAGALIVALLFSAPAPPRGLRGATAGRHDRARQLIDCSPLTASPAWASSPHRSRRGDPAADGDPANAQAAKRLLARAGPELEDLRSCLDDIVSDDKRASDVIRRTWQLLKRTEIVSMPLAVNDLAANMIGLVANDALFHAVYIDFFPAARLPVAYGDPVQIQQVIPNLLTNAITAAANGGAPTRKVTVWTTDATAPYLELGVHDSGKGIAEGDLGRIFEPFFTTKLDGLGIGWRSALPSSRPTRSPARRERSDRRRDLSAPPAYRSPSDELAEAAPRADRRVSATHTLASSAPRRLRRPCRRPSGSWLLYHWLDDWRGIDDLVKGNGATGNGFSAYESRDGVGGVRRALGVTPSSRTIGAPGLRETGVQSNGVSVWRRYVGADRDPVGRTDSEILPASPAANQVVIISATASGFNSCAQSGAEGQRRVHDHRRQAPSRFGECRSPGHRTLTLPIG